MFAEVTRSSITVLIVDDVPADRVVYQQYLHQDVRYTYHVLEASSVDQALTLCTQHVPDLIFLDYCLPDEDGMAFLQGWQTHYGNTPAPVVLLTEPEHEHIALEAMQQGAQDYLTKDQLTADHLHQVAHCVLEQVQLQQQLRSQQEQHSPLTSLALRLLQSSSDCIKVLNLNGQLLYLNEGGACILELDDPDALLNRQWVNFWPDQGRIQAEAAVATAKSGQLSRFQGFCPTAKGTPKWWDVAVTPILNDAGHVCQLLVTSRDITDLKQAEAQLQQINEKLTLANADLYRATRLKDEFLANMSHELRTPLNAILGLSEVLQDQTVGELNAKQQAFVQTIEHSGQHLLALINDILDLAKVESGKLELQLAPVSINYLCVSSLTLIRQQAIAKTIELTTEIAPGLPDIMVDELRIRQILINLLSNAVKFTPDGGKVKLRIQDEQPGEPDQGLPGCDRTLAISVIDTGIGIASTELDKLFQPFTQVDSQLNRKHNGTGLGLSLVRRLVELHQGRITVTSELGQGSCFTIRLPYRVAIAQSSRHPGIESVSPNDSSRAGLGQTHRPQPTNPNGWSAPLILIAEDNEANAITIASYLEGRGYRWLRAVNGQDAINQTRQHQPALILMDIQMPEVSGLEAIRQIRSDPVFQHLPIIAMTALAMPHEWQQCLQAGANQHIAKPVKLKHLITEVQRLLANCSQST